MVRFGSLTKYDANCVIYSRIRTEILAEQSRTINVHQILEFQMNRNYLR